MFRKKDKVVKVLTLSGVIMTDDGKRLGSGEKLNLSGVRSNIDLAFKDSQAVILLVNSPGGSPTQSEVIFDHLRFVAQRTGTPVITVIEDVAASGGYWIALAGDEILVRTTSVVGSIGVITASFGFSDLLQKVGVERRLFTAGNSKSRLDPFSPLEERDVEWMHSHLEELHEVFERHVRTRRSEQCGKEPEGVYDGEIYCGIKAVEKGLADGVVKSIEELVSTRFPGCTVEYVKTKNGWMHKFFGTVSAGVIDGISTTVSERLARASVGL